MHYKQHIFVCTNQKVPGKTCCASGGGADAFAYLNKNLKAKGLSGPGKIRVSQSGCLGRCRLGPCVVIYPEGIWYTYTKTADLDEIIETHFEKGEVCKALQIVPSLPD